uniref:Uncharacterized protein n=1 Tax=Panagrolaimus davidi TaxID=227884 RepID=A0A914QKR5_9BILA
MTMAIQSSFAFHNELHPVDLNESEIIQNRSDETYMDYFKRALKIVLTQMTCNGITSYLPEDEQNSPNAPLNSIEIACEGVEGPATNNTNETPINTEPAKIELQPIILRPIIKTPEAEKIMKSKVRQSYKPMSFEQKAIFNSYLQRQKLQIDCENGDNMIHAFAP